MEQNDIKRIIAENLSKGLPLSDIHKLLFDEHKVKITFMELRLLASELENIDWEKFSPKKAEPEKTPEEDAEPIDDECLEEDAEDSESPAENAGQVRGNTSLEVNKIARPGAILSGSVQFGSGASAEWVLDQLGRIALSNAKGKPDEQDIKEFQVELQKAVSGGGY